jgi:predicted nucleotidyltransferase
MITKDNNYKVMKLFLDSPDRMFHIREIARLTGISSTGVIKIVKRLKEEKLLTSHKGKVTEDVKADFKGRFPQIKRSYNLQNILESGIVQKLSEFYEEPKAIILFGSYAQGTDTSESDIDIAIETVMDNVPYVRRFEKTLGRKLSLYPFTRKKSGIEFQNSLANGIVLQGFLEVAS